MWTTAEKKECWIRTEKEKSGGVVGKEIRKIISKVDAWMHDPSKEQKVKKWFN